MPRGLGLQRFRLPGQFIGTQSYASSPEENITMHLVRDEAQEEVADPGVTISSRFLFPIRLDLAFIWILLFPFIYVIVLGVPATFR
mmetsp:Transcript_24796/g.36670  ORF Transcript_24796/g.36670 Transcript_24796/m.36670 type:complete len:86 (+) Transcript_24796:280-537(+)